MTAENGAIASDDPASASFNEAAADDRGKQRDVVRFEIEPRPASMRPRPMTAENPAVGAQPEADRLLQ